MSALSLVLLLLGASVLAVVVFRRFNLPPVLGYLFVGSVIGPHALNLMNDMHRAEYLAEFGVVFLMLTRGFRPYPISLVRVWLWTEFYFVVTLVVDLFTGFNYGFLLHKPEAFSILSFLSDSWPLYLLQLHGVALLFFLTLYAPFAIFNATKRGLMGKEGKQKAAL